MLGLGLALDLEGRLEARDALVLLLQHLLISRKVLQSRPCNADTPPLLAHEPKAGLVLAVHNFNAIR